MVKYKKKENLKRIFLYKMHRHHHNTDRSRWNRIVHAYNRETWKSCCHGDGNFTHHRTSNTCEKIGCLFFSMPLQVNGNVCVSHIFGKFIRITHNNIVRNQFDEWMFSKKSSDRHFLWRRSLHWFITIVQLVNEHARIVYRIQS